VFTGQMTTPTHDPAQLAELLDDILALFQRYVVFSDAAAVACTLFVAETHVYDSFSVAPYVLVWSPTKRAGKSVVLEIFAELVARAFEAIVPSAASIYRQMALHPTLIIDEADQTSFTPLLRAIFNRGYRRGGYVTRSNGKGGISRFEVYSPKAFAGIAGKRLPLPETLVDRSIRIELRRKSPDEHVERFSRNALSVEAGLLHDRLQAWADEVRENLAALDPPALPEQLNDRARETWEPLITIAGQAGPAWLRLARTAAVTLSSTDDEISEGEALLYDSRAVLDEHRTARIKTTDLINSLALLPDPRYHGPHTPQAVAATLRPFKIGPKPLRFGSEVRQGYERRDFDDAWRRYCP
jgi:hypothetical protein